MTNDRIIRTIADHPGLSEADAAAIYGALADADCIADADTERAAEARAAVADAYETLTDGPLDDLRLDKVEERLTDALRLLEDCDDA